MFSPRAQRVSWTLASPLPPSADITDASPGAERLLRATYCALLQGDAAVSCVQQYARQHASFMLLRVPRAQFASPEFVSHVPDMQCAAGGRELGWQSSLQTGPAWP